MGKKIVWFVVISLLISPLMSLGAFAYQNEQQVTSVLTQHQSTTPMPTNTNPSITITSPEQGYLYLFKLQPIKMTLASYLGLKCAVVIGRTLNIETDSVDIHHAKFVATQLLTGWKTIRWDYRTMDGLTTDFGLTSGIYNITVTAYNETDHELAHDSINVFYLKIGGQDFGVWVNTKYNGGETISTPLQLGVNDFTSMLNTGESKQFKVSMQNKDDTNVELQFTRTKIINNTEKVVEVKCNVDTTCDSTKEYEVSVEARFPFTILEGGQPSDKNNPYFSAKIGYISSAGSGGANRVNTTFYAGRENLNDPRVFRLSVKPENIESGSHLTFYTNYLTVNSTGDEVFQRTYSIDFQPATELTITSIPSEAKISYEFGRSAGVPTTISLRAEGGAFDDIIQSYTIDPLPSYMTFDLTLLGSREFLYQSDRSYNVTYALDSEQNGNLLTFEVLKLPTQIHASWGIDLGTFGDLSASSFAELNMSQDIERLALYVKGNEQPLVTLENFPRKIRFETAVDVPNGVGNITIYRQTDEIRQLSFSLAFNEILVTKSFELKDNFMRLSWNINLSNGTGLLDVSRDSTNIVTLNTSIVYRGWTFTHALTLKNTHLAVSWDVNREQRTGRITCVREGAGGDPSLSFSIAHNDWTISDTFDFKNTYLNLFWMLPTDENHHAEINLTTGGDQLFTNTLSVVDNGVELLHLGFGIQAEDHFAVTWDYLNGHISNFSWSGRVLQLNGVDIAVNLVGDVFTISADLSIGSSSGAVQMQFNKNVEVTFADTATDAFQLQGNVSFNANKRLEISWALGDSGHFTIYTFGQPIGNEFNLEFGYDPFSTGTYKYGFRLTGQNFINITRTIQWYSENGQLVRVWVLGDLPLPGDWTIHVLWNYIWYTVPWP